MDEDSGNSGDKLNWRERLGIGKNAGGTELPKVADEFKPPVQPASKVMPRATPQAPRATPQAPRAGQHTMAKTAPMAPRSAVPRDQAQRPAPAPVAVKAPMAAPAQRPNPAAPIAPRPANPAPRMPPVAVDALAAKLKEQREAAEKLAVQRVAAAKQKTDPTPAPTAKPKFAFAEPEAALPKAAAPTVSAPPPVFKPTLYPNSQSDAQMPDQQPSYQTAYSPNPTPAYGQQPPASYRPIDPATGHAQSSPFQPRPQGALPPQQQAPPFRSNSAFRAANPSFQAQPMPTRQPSLGQPAMGQSGMGQPGMSQPRMPQMPMPQNTLAGPRLGSIAKDDVFEQAAPGQRGQRRATANDYRQAYQDELSDGYDQDRPRALGWILTAVILALLVAFGGWYYLQFNKGSKIATIGHNPPVVEAPASPAKVAASPAAGTAPADQAGKKLIYDRIEGDHEVPGGPLKSSEQTPNLQDGTVPPPAASDNGGAVPLPLPPPPGGQQGSISGDGKSDVATITPAAEQSSAANSSQPPSTAPTSTAATTDTAAIGDLPMPSGTDAPPAAPAAEAAQAANPATPAITEPKVVAKKAAVLKPTKELAGEPLVLVPVSKPVARLAHRTVPKATQEAAITPPISTDGGGLYGNAPAAAPANIEKTTAPSAPASAAGGGYEVQLASFSTQAEANAEYQRLAAKHGAAITRYAPIIVPAQVAGTTRYRLNLGPMASNDVAQNVCSSLIAAGERDCLVHQ